jgi:D-lactate dehydrogenase
VALVQALQSGHLGGAGLDVFEGETLVLEEAELLSKAYNRDQLESAIHAHQLLKRDDVIVTPHNAFNSYEAVGRILETTIGNIDSFLAGSPKNVVRAPTGA